MALHHNFLLRSFFKSLTFCVAYDAIIIDVISKVGESTMKNELDEIEKLKLKNVYLNGVFTGLTFRTTILPSRSERSALSLQWIPNSVPELVFFKLSERVRLKMC